MTDAAAESSAVVRAVFFGSGSFAVPILDALAEMPGVRLEAVVSAPDRPVGRKAIVTPTPVTARARELGLPVLQPVRVRLPESVEAVRLLVPDLIVLADYGQIIPRVMLDLPARGFLNLHPSALPRHRGAAPIPATILAGDTESAVTLIVVTEEMDAGPIVAVAPLDVRSDDTSVTLEARAADVAAALLRRALPEWLAGRLEARPQPTDGVTMTRPLRREDGRLDPARSAVELERQVRAYEPWPGAYIVSDKTRGGRLIIKKARVVPSQPGDANLIGGLGPPSVAFVAPSEPPYFPTSNGRLVLEVMQAAGGRAMDAADFVRGHPDIVR